MAPRTEEQFEELREKSREKILNAALELFAGNGYEATSVEKIAKKAGVSKGLIYNYFESKKTILMAILNGAMKTGEDMVQSVMEIDEPHERMRTVVNGVFKMMREQPEYLKLLTVLYLQPGVMAEAKEFNKMAYNKNLEWAGKVTGKRPDRNGIIQSLILNALLDGISLNYYFYGNDYPLDELQAQLIKDYCLPAKNEK